MNLYYNGVDITDNVDVTAAVLHDVSGGCCDHMELEFENAALWLSWKPKTDDTVEVVQGSYSSGVMYLSAMYPSEGRFRILAAAMPSTARKRLYVSYKGMKLSGILRSCALECGMEHRLYGVEDALYPYAMRQNEGCAAFLERIAKNEGAVLKCWNGRLTMIGIEAAQRINAAQLIEQSDAMTGFDYTKDERLRVRRLTVITPFARYTAEDTGANGNEMTVRTDIPATDAAQAARWAKGLLLAQNRHSETLIVRSTFNSGYSAMVRIDISGENGIGGAWLIDSVEHDLIRMSSTATLRRCIDTVV